MSRILGPALLFLFTAALGFTQSGQFNLVKPSVADQDLVIPRGEITENAIFYPVDIDGTRIEVLVVKAPDGTIRTAFNTCRSCYSSGRGFYKQQGPVLVCQNCGRRFRMSQVGLLAGGCNPVPILAANKTETDTAVIIPRNFLREAKNIFRNWKRT
jgi:uncharacterized membrane protein